MKHKRGHVASYENGSSKIIVSQGSKIFTAPFQDILISIILIDRESIITSLLISHPAANVSFKEVDNINII